MRAFFARQLARVRRQPRRERRDWVVLLYHRVTELASDPWALSVTPRHFDEQLAVLKRRAVPMPLADLDAALARGERPRRAVVVTFDDGYRDNLREARPLLERHGIPATCFVSTGPVADRRGFWWDQLERALLSPGAVPRTLGLTIQDRHCHWDFGDAAGQSPHGPGARQWRAWEEPPTPRHACYYELWQMLQRMTHEERSGIVDALLAWAGLETEPGAQHQTMTTDEVRALAADDLVELGSHGVTHSALAALPVSEQEYEITRSKADLETMTGRPVTSFAYPFGRRVDYTTDTAAVVRAAGYARACSAAGEPPDPRLNRLEIPRVHVNDLDGVAFTSWLSHWLDD
jgi:peptidoglycan/xylan/chitin deacetylase (PgdA/CDA1 family)